MGGTYNEVHVKKLGQKRKKVGSRKPVQPAPGMGSSRETHGAAGSGNAPCAENSSGATWPALLLEFVNRAFEQAAALSEPQKAVFNEQIQTLIYTAARDNKIWTNDWLRQRLPVFDPGAPLVLFQDTGAQACAAAAAPAAHSRPPSGASATFDSLERKRQRAARFQGPAAPLHAPQAVQPGPAGKAATIVGTLEALEKRYLRLTSEPDPSLVRPKRVLLMSLAFVVDKYLQGALYAYLNDQLKAIRQDMTVQHITSELAVQVYETHGRIAIENNDLGEFNQCQSQLRHLYALRPGRDFYKNTYEFTCYRILYLLLTGNYADINLTRLELMDADAATVVHELEPGFRTRRECVYKALQLVDHVVLGNYHAFFRVYKWYQDLGIVAGASHLLRQFMVTKQRVLSLNTICKGFKRVPLALLEDQLALDSPAQFLAEFGLHMYASETDFDCSAARAAVQAIVDQGRFKKIDIKGQV